MRARVASRSVSSCASVASSSRTPAWWRVKSGTPIATAARQPVSNSGSLFRVRVASGVTSGTCIARASAIFARCSSSFRSASASSALAASARAIAACAGGTDPPSSAVLTRRRRVERQSEQGVQLGPRRDGGRLRTAAVSFSTCASASCAWTSSSRGLLPASNRCCAASRARAAMSRSSFCDTSLRVGHDAIEIGAADRGAHLEHQHGQLRLAGVDGRLARRRSGGRACLRARVAAQKCTTTSAFRAPPRRALQGSIAPGPRHARPDPPTAEAGRPRGSDWPRSRE